MYHYNQSGSTWIQIPFAGRWLVHVHTVWDKIGSFGPRVPSTLNLLVNGNYIHESGNTLFRDISSSYETILDRYVFSSGDKITLAFWSAVTATVLPAGRLGTSTTTYTEDRTYMLARYLGPS